MTSGILDHTFSSLKEISKELSTVAELTVEENEHVIIDMNTENLFEGRNAKNRTLESIGGPYAPKTIEFKKLKGQPYDRVTLKDTGDFYEGFFVKPLKRGWQLGSKDAKTNKLKEDWGEDIFGNTDADEQEINKEYILPELLEHVIETVKL